MLLLHEDGLGAERGVAVLLQPVAVHQVSLLLLLGEHANGWQGLLVLEQRVSLEQLVLARHVRLLLRGVSHGREVLGPHHVGLRLHDRLSGHRVKQLRRLLVGVASSRCLGALVHVL